MKSGPESHQQKPPRLEIYISAAGGPSGTWQTAAPSAPSVPTHGTLLRSRECAVPPEGPFFLEDGSRAIKVTSTSSFLGPHKSASSTPALNAYLFWMSRR